MDFSSDSWFSSDLDGKTKIFIFKLVKLTWLEKSSKVSESDKKSNAIFVIRDSRNSDFNILFDFQAERISSITGIVICFSHSQFLPAFPIFKNRSSVRNNFIHHQNAARSITASKIMTGNYPYKIIAINKAIQLMSIKLHAWLILKTI